MNSDTIEAAQEVLKEAGAIVRCDRCGKAYVMAYDPDAEQWAYDQAENLRKAGERGFRGMSREEVEEVIKAALDDAPSTCPNCRS